MFDPPGCDSLPPRIISGIVESDTAPVVVALLARRTSIKGLRHFERLDIGRPRWPKWRKRPMAARFDDQRQNARTSRTWGVEWPIPGQPFATNWPRSDFLNRASFPFVLISRRMALYSVAAGVWPFGLDQ